MDGESADDGARRKRVGKPKVKTGCLTCRVRRVKCDEAKGKCQRCRKSGFSCEYPKFEKKTDRTTRAIRIRPKDTEFALLQEKPVVLPIARLAAWKASRLPSQPSVSSFQSEQESRYFRIFCDRVADQLAGFYNDGVWNRVILQAGQQDTSVRSAIVAVGALSTTLLTASSEVEPQHTSTDRHHEFALQNYSRALRQTRQSILEKRHNLRTTLLMCLLIVCFESLHGNHTSALSQIQSGVSLLEEWIKENDASAGTLPESPSPSDATRAANKRNYAAVNGFGMSSPAKYIIEDELIQAFGRLDMQASSFVDPRPTSYHEIQKNCGAIAISNMPAKFTSINEARAYWELVMRRLMHFIGGHASMGYMNARVIPSVVVEPEITTTNETKPTFLGSVNTALIPAHLLPPALVEEWNKHLKETTDWAAAFAPIRKSMQLQQHSKDYLASTNLHLRFLTAYIALSSSISNAQTIFDQYLPSFREIVYCARILLAHPTSTFTFAFDMGFVPQLYVVAIRCRDQTVRREAIRLLLSKHWREGLWDSYLAGNMATAIMETEEKYAVGDEIPEEGRVRGTQMTFDLTKREGKLVCFLNATDANGKTITEEKDIRW